MKLFVLGFRVVAHISMLPVRGAHASVFPHPLFSFCVLIVNVPPWGYSNEPLSIPLSNDSGRRCPMNKPQQINR